MSATVTPQMARPKHPILQWLLADNAEVEPAVRNALLAAMFTPEPVVYLRLACGVLNILACLVLSGAFIFWVLIPWLIAAVMSYATNSRIAKTARLAGKPAPTDRYMWTMLGGLAAQGLFGGTEMASNIPILQLLALFIAIAGCGAVCAVQFPARRFASVLIGLFLVPLAAGSIAAGSRPLLYLPVMLIIYAGICAGNITSRRQTALADIQARFNADRLARLDYLTGLLNRLALTEAITELERTGTTQFSVFCLDIDGLKAINHEYGRGAGDGVLQAVAARLSVNVWHGDTIVRIAEDEFVLLAPGMQQAEAERLCKRLRQRIQRTL